MAAIAISLGLALWPASPAPADTLPPATPPSGQCPLTGAEITVVLEASSVQARVGHPAKVRVKVSPPQPPPGFYYSAIVDVVAAPQGAEPKVVSGVPETLVTASRPGPYRLRIKVTLIAKSSCGGAKATILMEDEVKLTVL